MTSPRVRVLALIATSVLGASVLGGCGGSGGGTTTTATPSATTSPGDGMVTIQTDTVVTNTAPGTRTSGTTGNPQLDNAITAMTTAIRQTMADLGATDDLAVLVQTITTREEAFDRASQQVHDVVAEDGAATNTQHAIDQAAPALLQAYRDFPYAATQAAANNDRAGLASAKAALTDALHTFGQLAGTGS